MDVVYILGSGSVWKNNELRFSLRSLEKFISGVGTVYVVGNRPDWLVNVVHLPFPDLYTCKERNIMLKVAHACGHPDLSDRFLHVHDDHFALAPGEAADVPNWACGSLLRMSRPDPRGGRSHWREAVKNTHDALTAKGLPGHNFDIHYPIIFDKTRYPEIMDRYNWDLERGFVVKSLYANTLQMDPVFIHDRKINDRLSMSELVDRLRGVPWFSVGNKGLTNNMQALMYALYPEPSKYESNH